MVNGLLTLSLSLAVPLEIDRMRAMDDDLRRLHIDTIRRRNHYPSNTVAAYGDDLLYGGKRCGSKFAELTRILACLAWAPGGATVGGMHFCADHAECEAALDAAKSVEAN